MASTKPDIEVVDDIDPRIGYLGTWQLGGVPGELHETAHGTIVKGSRVEFTFKGMFVTLN